MGLTREIKIILPSRVREVPQKCFPCFYIGVVNRHFHAKLHVSSTNHLEGKPRTDGRTAGQTNGHDTLNYKSAET